MTSDLSVRRSSVLFAGVALVVTLLNTGCNRGPSMAQVSGTVKYKDGSIPQGAVALVSFQPADDTTAEVRKGATGPIQPDGSFEMLTRMPGDGVYLGKYNVTFTVLKTLSHDSSMVDPKFTRASTTPFTVEVTGDMDDLSYEIEKAPGAAAAGS